MSKLNRNINDIASIFVTEIKNFLSDRGVVLVFFVAGLLYPILYSLIYNQEVLRNVPVAVVDDAKCSDSRRFINKIDATPEMVVNYECNTLEEAKKLLIDRKINGIVYFPSDYGQKLADREQARVVLFCDMSSFLYYKSVFLGNNLVMLDELKHVQTERYSKLGKSHEETAELVAPVGYEDVGLFQPTAGFASFLIPVLLILIVHQTLFFGVGMSVATSRENGTARARIPQNLTVGSAINYTFAMNLALLCIYFFIAAFGLIIVPYIFNLPHEGRMTDLCAFLLPFMLATINFSLTFSVFIRNRESGILSLVFFSIILLFLSGFAWPTSNIPTFWKLFSYIFPSTHGIQGYIRLRSMGASLPYVKFEYVALWIQAIFYFITACLSLFVIDYRSRKNVAANLSEVAA